MRTVRNIGKVPSRGGLEKRMHNMMKAVVVACFLIATALFAQFESAEVLGTVRDPSGGAIPKATVTLTNMDTGIQAKTATDESGNYDFFNVKVGRYSVAVEQAGFSKFTTTDVDVSCECPAARGRLHAGRRDHGIRRGDGRGRRPGDGFERTRPGDQHGGGGGTSAQRPQLCGPGAACPRTPSSLPSRPSFSPSGTPREGAFNVNGMRSTYNNFLLDGLDNNAYGTSNQGYSAQLVQLSPDALAEFKVITSNYSAEYGRVGGAVVNAVMKSGTNEFHGTRLRIPAQHRSERHRLPVQPRRLREAHPAAQPVRRHHRRTDRQEQAILLRGLRGLPPVAALSQFRLDSQHDGSPGHPPRDGGQPADRRRLSGQHADPGGAVESVRRRGPGRAAADQWPRALQQRRGAAADPRLRRQVRRQDSTARSTIA